jgi:ankyrin repeat protein
VLIHLINAVAMVRNKTFKETDFANRSRDTDGLTMLHMCALNGYHMVVEHLITKYHVNVNALDINENTPLHYAGLLVSFISHYPTLS